MRFESNTSACSHFLRDFSDFIDGRLASRRQAELRAHLDCCEACLRHLASYRRGIALYREGNVEADPGFYDRFEQRLWLDGELGRDIDEPAVGRRSTVSLAAAATIAIALFWSGWQSGQLSDADPTVWSGGTPAVSVASVIPGVARRAERTATFEQAESVVGQSSLHQSGEIRVAAVAASIQNRYRDESEHASDLRREIERLHEKVMENFWLTPAPAANWVGQSASGEVLVLTVHYGDWSEAPVAPWTVEAAINLP